LEEDKANDQNTDGTSVQWPNDVHYCDELVYRIQVTNFREVPIKCKILFNENFDHDSDKKINLFYPRGGFKAMV
jgi:hypothetical protein